MFQTEMKSNVANKLFVLWALPENIDKRGLYLPESNRNQISSATFNVEFQY
jgi:hypothetical protein